MYYKHGGLSKEATKPSLHIIALTVWSVAYSSYHSISFFKELFKTSKGFP